MACSPPAAYTAPPSSSTYTNVLRWYDDTNLLRWFEEIGSRDSVVRGRMVNRSNGPPEGQLRERHDASDFELRRPLVVVPGALVVLGLAQDKLEAAE